MKSPILFLLVLVMLLVNVAPSQAREEVQVLVTKSRNAVIRDQTNNSSSDLSGVLHGSTDFASGLSALVGDLTLKPNPDIGDGSVKGYAQLNGKTLEAIGSLDLPATAHGSVKVPDKLDVDLESITNTKTAFAKGNFAFVGSTPKEMPTVNLNGQVQASGKQLSGEVDYSVTLKPGQGKAIPLSSVALTFNDAKDVTTLALTLVAPTDSSIAPRLKQLPGMADMISSRLQMVGLQVQKVSIPKPKTVGKQLTAQVTIAVKDLRQTLSTLIALKGGAMGNIPGVPADALVKAVTSMLTVRFNNVQLTMSLKGDDVSGSVSGKLTHIKEFLTGYAKLMAVIAKAQDKMYPATGSMGPFMRALNQVNIEQSVKVFKVMAESNQVMNAKGAFHMQRSVQPNHKAAEPKLAMNGNLQLSIDNYQDYIAKARAAGLPVVDQAQVLAKLQLTGAKRYKGTFYLNSQADQDKILAYYQKLLAEALSRSGSSKKASSSVANMNVKDMVMSFDLQGTKLKLAGYGQTSDLTDAAEALQNAIFPKLQGTPTGLDMAFDFKPDHTGSGSLGLHFSNFMPGKSADEIRHVLSLPASTKVDQSASSDAVKLVAVQQPEVKLSPDLASVRTQSQKLLAASTPGGRKSKLNWLLVLGGLLVLILVGVGLAAGRKKS